MFCAKCGNNMNQDTVCNNCGHHQEDLVKSNTTSAKPSEAKTTQPQQIVKPMATKSTQQSTVVKPQATQLNIQQSKLTQSATAPVQATTQPVAQATPQAVAQATTQPKPQPVAQVTTQPKPQPTPTPVTQTQPTPTPVAQATTTQVKPVAQTQPTPTPVAQATQQPQPVVEPTQATEQPVAQATPIEEPTQALPVAEQEVADETKIKRKKKKSKTKLMVGLVSLLVISALVVAFFYSPKITVMRAFYKLQSGLKQEVSTITEQVDAIAFFGDLSTLGYQFDARQELGYLNIDYRLTLDNQADKYKLSAATMLLGFDVSMSNDYLTVDMTTLENTYGIDLDDQSSNGKELQELLGIKGDLTTINYAIVEQSRDILVDILVKNAMTALLEAEYSNDGTQTIEVSGQSLQADVYALKISPLLLQESLYSVVNDMYDYSQVVELVNFIAVINDTTPSGIKRDLLNGIDELVAEYSKTPEIEWQVFIYEGNIAKINVSDRNAERYITFDPTGNYLKEVRYGDENTTAELSTTLERNLFKFSFNQSNGKDIDILYDMNVNQDNFMFKNRNDNYTIMSVDATQTYHITVSMDYMGETFNLDAKKGLLSDGWFEQNESFENLQENVDKITEVYNIIKYTIELLVT